MTARVKALPVSRSAAAPDTDARLRLEDKVRIAHGSTTELSKRAMLRVTIETVATAARCDDPIDRAIVCWVVATVAMR